MNFATVINRDCCPFIRYLPCPERRANHLLSITRMNMTSVMANCGGNNHFQHGRTRNSHEREITGTVQDILERTSPRNSASVIKGGAVFTASKSGTVPATLRIPAVGERADLADDCGDLPESSGTETWS